MHIGHNKVVSVEDQQEKQALLFNGKLCIIF